MNVATPDVASTPRPKRSFSETGKKEPVEEEPVLKKSKAEDPTPRDSIPKDPLLIFPVTKHPIEEIMGAIKLPLSAYKGYESLVGVLATNRFHRPTVSGLLAGACHLWLVCFEAEGDVEVDSDTEGDQKPPDNVIAAMEDLMSHIKSKYVVDSDKKELLWKAWLATHIMVHLTESYGLSDHHLMHMVPVNFILNHHEVLGNDEKSLEEALALSVIRRFWHSLEVDSIEECLQQEIDEAHAENEPGNLYDLYFFQIKKEEEEEDEEEAEKELARDYDILRQLELKDCDRFVEFFKKLMK